MVKSNVADNEGFCFFFSWTPRLDASTPDKNRSSSSVSIYVEDDVIQTNLPRETEILDKM